MIFAMSLDINSFIYNFSSGGGGRGGGNKRRTFCTCGYKGVQTVRPGSIAGGGCLRHYGTWNVP